VTGHSVDAATVRLAVATATQDWSTVMELVESSWRQVQLDDPRVLFGAVRALPVAAVRDHPMVLAVRSWVLRLPAADDPPLPRPDRLSANAVGVLGRTSQAPVAADTALALSLAYRRRGQYQLALGYAEETLALVRVAVAAGDHWAAPRLAPALLQVSTVWMHLLDNVRAVPYLLEAYAQGEDAGGSTRPDAVAEAAGALGLVYAKRGQHVEARFWLEREAAARAVRGSAAATPAHVARATLALDALDAAGCARELQQLSEDARFDEFWMYALYLRSLFALAWGDRVALLGEMRSARQGAPLREANRNGGRAGSILATAEANLLMSVGRGSQAWAVLAADTRQDRYLSEARARWALLSGDYSAALDITADAAGLPVRFRVPITLIRATALHRLGRDGSAARAMDLAVSLSDRDSLYSFGEVPRADLLALISLSRSGGSLLDPAALAELPDIYPAALTFLELTRRERAVLIGLDAGLRPTELAARLNLSPTTVKTHQRSLYRKLSVNSRGEALAVAAGLGLLAESELSTYY
jgi:LuxR family maltose regulon positive regulatory protein